MEYNRGYNCAFNSASFPPFHIKTARTRPFSAAAMNYPSRRSVFGRNRVVSLRVIEKSCARTLCREREFAGSGKKQLERDSVSNVTANVGHTYTDTPKARSRFLPCQPICRGRFRQVPARKRLTNVRIFPR